MGGGLSPPPFENEKRKEDKKREKIKEVEEKDNVN